MRRRGWYRKWKRKGYLTIAGLTLIKVTGFLQKPDEVTKLCEKIIQYLFQPTIHTYNMLMELYFLDAYFTDAIGEGENDERCDVV